MHGHELLLEYLKKIEDLENKTLIEIGTTRDFISEQDSSYIFYNFCKENKMRFITVDMDSENTESIKNRCENINAITSKGEIFLKEFNSEIDFLYLDAFDFYHENHSDKRKNKYKEILKTTINNNSCYKMHLDCCINSIDKIKIGGYICIDDVLNDMDYSYKGKEAVPFLLENGFEIIKFVPNCIILKKK